MRYYLITPDQPLEGETPEQLLDYMRRSNHTLQFISMQHYMNYLAVQVNDFSGGLSLHAETPEDLVADLVAHGWLFTA